MTINVIPDVTAQGNDVFQTTTVNLPIPASITLGMLLVIGVDLYNNQTSVPTITGSTSTTAWTSFGVFAADGDSYHLKNGYWKIADAGDVTDSAAGTAHWTLNCTDGFIVQWAIAGWAGVNSSTPFAAGPSIAVAASTTFTFNSVTAPAGGGVWAGILLEATNCGAVTDPTAPPTKRIQSTSPNTSEEVTIYSTAVSAGATSMNSGTVASGFQWATISFVLNPAAAGGALVAPPQLVRARRFPAWRRTRGSVLFVEPNQPAGKFPPPVPKTFNQRRQLPVQRRRQPVSTPPVTVVVAAPPPPPKTFGRRPQVPALRRRQPVVIPLTVTVTVPTGRRRPVLLPTLRRRQPVAVPVTVTVVAASQTPPQTSTRRPLLPAVRRRTPVTTPYAVVVVTPALQPPPIPERRSTSTPTLRRRQPINTPPTVVTVTVTPFVPTPVARRSRLIPTRRGQITPTPPVVAVVVVPAIPPTIPARHRLDLLIRRRPEQPTVTVTAVTTTPAQPPPSVPPRRRFLLPTRHGVTSNTPPAAVVVTVTVNVPPIQSRRGLLALLRRRGSTLATPAPSTATPSALPPTTLTTAGQGPTVTTAASTGAGSTPATTNVNAAQGPTTNSAAQGPTTTR